MNKRKQQFLSIALCFVFGSLITISDFALAGVRTVQMSDKSVRTIWIRPGQGVVLNFPIKPSKAILGSSSSFKIEYVKNDLVIGATRYGSQTNLFVYLEGRRFAFRLVTSKSKYDDIVLVRDRNERKVKLEVK